MVKIVKTIHMPGKIMHIPRPLEERPTIAYIQVNVFEGYRRLAVEIPVGKAQKKRFSLLTSCQGC